MFAFALEFSDNLDPTALATVGLALVTFATVVVGGLALRRTRSEIDLSRREVEEAHRPVLIPLVDDNEELREFDAPTIYRAKPRYQENNRLVLPIKNIGSGPALNIAVSVRVRDERGELLPLIGDRRFMTALLGLGVSEMTAVTVYVPSLGDMPFFELWLTYADVAGKTWRTSADYSKRDGGVYEGMSIDPIEPGTSAPTVESDHAK